MSDNHPPPMVEVSNLKRSFGGILAVNGISFNLQRGAVTGFIGANGAGKTTTMRMLATLDQPDSGSIKMDGVDLLGYPDEVRVRIGWMPDHYGTYQNMTVGEYLDFFARSYGLKGEARRSRVRDVMHFTDLTPLTDRLITKLSKGMGQRLCLGRTLLHDPDFLILDEPAAGLDPKARVEFKNLVAQLKVWKKTVLISSHILSELGEMCDDLLFIDAGRILHHGSSEELVNRHIDLPTYVVGISGDVEALCGWISIQPGVELAARLRQGARIRLPSDDPQIVSGLLMSVLQAGFRVIDFHKDETKIEDAFIHMVKGAATPPPLPKI